MGHAVALNEYDAKIDAYRKVLDAMERIGCSDWALAPKLQAVIYGYIQQEELKSQQINDNERGSL